MCSSSTRPSSVRAAQQNTEARYGRSLAQAYRKLADALPAPASPRTAAYEPPPRLPPPTRDLAAVRLALALDARDLRVFVAEYFPKSQEERRRTNTARSTGLRPFSSTKKAIESVSSRGNASTGFGTTPSGRQGFGQPGTDVLLDVLLAPRLRGARLVDAQVAHRRREVGPWGAGLSGRPSPSGTGISPSAVTTALSA